MKTAQLMKEVWVPGQGTFQFAEKIDPHTGKTKYILKGLMLPFNKISRNNVLYNEASVREKHKDLIGRPVMYNHKVEDTSLPVGHFINSYCDGVGWHYEADIDPHERDMIRKLERGDLRHVSIQLIGGRVEERFNQESGLSFTEAYVSDIIEGSIVPAPGFLDTTAAFAEALSLRHDATTSTADGAIGGPLMPGDLRSEGAEKLFPLLKQAYPSIEDAKLSAAAVIVEELLSRSLEDLQYVSSEIMAESFIRTLGEDDVARILREVTQ